MSLTMSGKLTMPADEWQKNGCIKPYCEAFKRCPRAVVNCAEHWTHWRALDDGELDYLPWNFSLRRPLDVVLILAKLGIDQLLTYASLCWRTRRLSLLSPPLLYAHAER